ncbi:hypothetical protein BCON_0055g00270 [Botryotinia convoluta]|uniref:Uncharacterized protein n=1 Tax=Botryotinia convoluta TaxID=54673 RepID=A0A4Z1ICT8_9HELO|nr:hypothetical protein BCON_0055g00270 [Botryotinia convoluta]
MAYMHTEERPLSYAEAILVRGGCPYQALATATDRSETADRSDADNLEHADYIVADKITAVMLVCSVCHADNTFPFDQEIDQAI